MSQTEHKTSVGDDRLLIDIDELVTGEISGFPRLNPPT